MVSGRSGRSRASASGTLPTTWSARTTTTCTSGTSVSARRPCSGPASRTIVPVSATATAQPVTTASAASRSATDRACVPSRRTSRAVEPRRRDAVRGDDPAQATLGQDAGDRGRERIGTGGDDEGPVVDQPVREQLEQRRRPRRVEPLGAVRPGRRPGRRGRTRRRRPDPAEDLLAGGHDERPAHHWRNDCRGGAGASRAVLHARSGGGRVRIRPPRASRRPAPIARSPAANRPGERIPQATADMAARSAEGSLRRSRSRSTCSPRRWTSIAGMSIFTGQTS